MVIKNEVILDTAARVLSRRPDATLDTIAKAAGISRTTIFNRYPTREDLLRALAVDTLERIGAAMALVPNEMPEDAAEALLAVTNALMPLGPRTIFLRLFPDEDGKLDVHWEQAATPLAIFIGTLQSTGRLRADQPARWLVASYVGLLFAAWDEIAAGEMGVVQASRLVTQTWLSGAGYRSPTQ